MDALTKSNIPSSIQTKTSFTDIVDLKSRGGLIHSNLHFFNLINFTEKCFSKHANSSLVFQLTVDEVLDDYRFTFPCMNHAADLLSYALFYYVRMRMRQFCLQENIKMKKDSSKKRKQSKLLNE